MEGAEDSKGDGAAQAIKTESNKGEMRVLRPCLFPQCVLSPATKIRMQAPSTTSGKLIEADLGENSTSPPTTGK